MSKQATLIELEQRPATDPAFTAGSSRVPAGELKLRRPNRRQVCFTSVDVEELIPADHAARAIWALTERFDLGAFAAELRSREGEAGRAAWEPRLLVSVWIFAYSEGIGSAREIERQCRHHPALRWLCGLETINHKTLSDFRAAHAAALDDVFTQLLALLSQAGVVNLEQVMVDGTRIRSQGSTSSMRRAATIERHLAAAREVVETMRDEEQAEQQSQRVRAARERAARERVERLEQAAEELEKVKAKKTREADKQAARVSESEPQARLQRESNGGWAAGYNAQLATAANEKIVVGVRLTNEAADVGQLEGAIEDVERRMGEKPGQVVADQGYASRRNVEAMKQAAVELVAPPPEVAEQSKAALKSAGIDEKFGPEAFAYEEASNTYRCPAGKRLRYRGNSTKRGKKYRRYQAEGSDCRECALRHQCCPKSFERGRTVSRASEDEVMAAHRRWMAGEKARAAYRRRAEVAEFPNACLKERIGLRKFRGKGLPKARSELLWALLAYNAAQWIRLVWRGASTPAAQPAGAG
jgi:transposase